MEKESLLAQANAFVDQMLVLLVDADTYSQLGIIVVIYVLAFLLTDRIRQLSPVLRNAPPTPKEHPFAALLYRSGKLLFPIFSIMLLRLSVEFSRLVVEDTWVMRSALIIAALLLTNQLITFLIRKPLAASACRWVGLPIIFFHFIGVLDDIVAVLDAMAVHIGNIRLSAYGIVRVIIFGSLLFWLGRVSNSTGQQIIRKQESLDIKTRELFAKLFEVGVFFVLALLILQVMGINLTALAVFGGAVGVGLGFGLQSIASNFISGIIILLDRSVSVGDYIELEDGRTGNVTELNMRATTLETFDGKDIVVPNEKFITTSFINWTHKNRKQRYRVDFSVAYKTDVRKLVELIKEAVAEHPQVLSGEAVPFEERPDCEIDSFGDSGINMFVEFWMEGIDDGKNRVGGDLLLTILETMQQHGFEIPFPQREVRILKED